MEETRPADELLGAWEPDSLQVLPQSLRVSEVDARELFRQHGTVRRTEEISNLVPEMLWDAVLQRVQYTSGGSSGNGLAQGARKCGWKIVVVALYRHLHSERG